MESVASQGPDEHVDLWQLPMCSLPDFQWGLLAGKMFCDKIDEAYNEIFHWKGNIFLIPSGTAGKLFVLEVTRLLKVFASGSAMECIALKASFVMHFCKNQAKKSKSRDHITHLKRQLELWKQGDIPSLFQEGRCIQQHLLNRSKPSDVDAIAQNFG